MKIAICLVTNRLIKPKTSNSLLELVNKSKLDFEIIVSTRGYTTAENRNHSSAQAVNHGCTHLFLVDDDMIYEPDTIERLLAHDKDIIGGMYYTKYETKSPVIGYLDDKRPEGLFECEALGGGLMLVKSEVFKKTPQPWFGYIWNDNGSIKESNDWFFCHAVQKAGYKVWCDSRIEAKHIGLKEF